MGARAETGPAVFNPSGPAGQTAPPGASEVPVKFQMRVVALPSTHEDFLKLCKEESQVPNRVIGGWIAEAVRTGKLTAEFKAPDDSPLRGVKRNGRR